MLKKSSKERIPQIAVLVARRDKNCELIHFLFLQMRNILKSTYVKDKENSGEENKNAVP